ncbi:hypothetical protein [Chryseobacterium sp. MFBS3-17]|uniref:hypothetical protein n=1 Tax=Chryseobacterium sp. MFBS3-17 TaxID=2886689 RepID=UPI001D0E33A9|nr:hypothetical protein [Chryseobacterium sp. MFBS3-17]MCC2591102.1 hypothetical protein [Chryseobacterium sp. MFBS3-17]
MKISAKNKSRAAVLLTGIYLFMAFFAFNMHRHSSGSVFKDFQFQKAEQSLQATDEHASDFTDCLSCHLLHQAKVLVPQEFSYHFFGDVIFTQQVFSWEQRFAGVVFHAFYLRGPPAFFV